MKAVSTKSGNPSILTAFLIISLLLMMTKSMRLYFTWNIPVILVSVAGVIATTFYVLYYYKKYSRVSPTNLALAMLLGIALAYEFFVVTEAGFLQMIATIATFCCAGFLIVSDIQTKELILKYAILFTKIIIGISLVAWILFLFGFPLPNYYTDSDEFYRHTVYHFFLLNGTPQEQLIPRFAGMFLEPGHLGSTACLVLYIERFNFRKIGNLILLAAVLFSLSLAAYGLLIGGLGIYLFINSKKGKWYFLLFVSFVIIVWFISMNYNSGNNYIYEKIFSRLVFEDGQMVGNNRTTSFFDTMFNRYIYSENRWFGMGRDAFGSMAGSNITIGTAGWKRFFFVRGIVGTTLLVLFLFMYTFRYRSKFSWGFLVVFIVANMIRDYPLKEYWLFLFILAIPVFHKYRNYKLT